MLPHYDKAVFELPDGPKNLSTLFPGVDFSQVAEYQVTLKDESSNVIVTTPYISLICTTDGYKRLVFENKLGRWDAVNFNRVRVIHETTASEFKTGTSTDKIQGGSERFNIRSNETYEAFTSCYPEGAQDWLMELCDSAKVFLQLNGYEGQPDTFVPVVVSGGKWDTRKVEDDWIYGFVIQFKMSNENINLRN